MALGHASGAIAGIGFTMSLFIAGQAFPGATDFAAAKIAVFAASMLSALVGTALLWGGQRQNHVPPPFAWTNGVQHRLWTSRNTG